ncbi:hypothetical protein PG994_002678 [Apiospora phragmitis]|uniref:Uncharacterized protein n=1 Tax=Apiospora phragmitis TaxID=2905665 RepID=A0ABR1W5T5_9PEZI
MHLPGYRITIAAAAWLLLPNIVVAAPYEEPPYYAAPESTQYFPQPGCTGLAVETVTTMMPVFNGGCRKRAEDRRFVCAPPTSTCRQDELPRQPYPMITMTRDCTPTVVVRKTYGCPTCLPSEATATAAVAPCTIDFVDAGDDFFHFLLILPVPM